MTVLVEQHQRSGIDHKTRHSILKLSRDRFGGQEMAAQESPSLNATPFVLQNSHIKITVGYGMMKQTHYHAFSCSLIITFWCFVKFHLHCISSSYPLVPPADVLSLFWCDTRALVSVGARLLSQLVKSWQFVKPHVSELCVTSTSGELFL